MATAITVGSAGGEYMEAVVVLEWHVSIGTTVKVGDVLVTVETAKAAVEVEASVDGVVSSILADVNAEVAVDAFLGAIGVSIEDTEVSASSDTSSAETPDVPAPASKDTLHEQVIEQHHRVSRVVASPAARREASRRNIDLASVSASSPSGRIKLRDLETHDAAGASFAVRFDLPSKFNEPGPLKVYRSGGSDGVPLVLLHGFASDAQSWSLIERALAASRPVLRIDLPNHGKSPKRAGGGFRALARDVTEAFDSLNLDRAHVVGHSLGGACALALADIRPKRIVSLTLIAPGGLSSEINAAFLKGIARASKPESLEPWLKLMVGDERLVGRDFVSAAMASRSDVTLREAQQQMVDDVFPDGTPGFDLRAAASRLACPTRIIWGKADTILPWRGALSVPGTVGVHLFDRVGHVPQLEAQDEVLKILRSVMLEGEA